MASTIGIRVYRIGVNQRGNISPVPLCSDDLRVAVPDFVSNFISKHATHTQNDELERSLYFQMKNDEGQGNSQGYVHYGTFGFESNFVDTKTKSHNYRRQTTDVEEIPLYYEFWFPEDEVFGFAAFQSFQGRSCINLVLSKMQQLFEKSNPGYILNYRKLQPNDAKGSAYFSAPVKEFRLIKRNASSDLADQYFDSGSPEPIDFEIVISARRNRSFGPLGYFLNSVKGGSKNVITHEGIEFPEAVAEIQIGGKKRRVGVLGFNGDAGVIDITDAITRGPDGHPTFESLRKEADVILRDFYTSLSGQKP